MAGNRRAKQREELYVLRRNRQACEGEENRKAFCVGCGKNYGQVHLLRQHRNQMRCGGRFLGPEERMERNLPL